MWYNYHIWYTALGFIFYYALTKMFINWYYTEALTTAHSVKHWYIVARFEGSLPKDYIEKQCWKYRHHYFESLDKDRCRMQKSLLYFILTVFGYSHFLYNHGESFLKKVDKERRCSLRDNTFVYSACFCLLFSHEGNKHASLKLYLGRIF